MLKRLGASDRGREHTRTLTVRMARYRLHINGFQLTEVKHNTCSYAGSPTAHPRASSPP